MFPWFTWEKFAHKAYYLVFVYQVQAEMIGQPISMDNLSDRTWSVT